MVYKKMTALFVLCAAIFGFIVSEARAQGSVPARSSEITSALMPGGAERLLPESVPAEFNQAFDNLIQEGAGKVVGGEREFLAWTGNYKNKTNFAKSISEVQTNFRSAGWKFEPQGKSGELELFSLFKDGSPRRVVLGFFVPGDDVFVCALVEVLLPGEKSTVTKTEINQPTTNRND